MDTTGTELVTIQEELEAIRGSFETEVIKENQEAVDLIDNDSVPVAQQQIEVASSKRNLSSESDCLPESGEEGIVQFADVPENGEEITIQFTVIESGTQRGHKLLLDNRGYTYTVKMHGKNGTKWWCSMRNRKKRCNATVKQTIDGFKAGKNEHSHQARPTRSLTNVNLTTEIKHVSRKMISAPARSIVMAVIDNYNNEGIKIDPLLSVRTLVRQANRARETLRLKNPKDLKFQINEEFIPEDFIKADIKCDSERHILMATPDQLSILADAKLWMVDCTKKFVKAPFTELLSIQTFMRIEDKLKCIPLAFVLMSNTRQRDYKLVLEHLLKILPHRQSVRKCVLDFKMQLWKVFQLLIPNVAFQGCAFRWTQRVMENAQKIDFTHEAELQVLSLVYIPPEEVEEALQRISKSSKSHQAVQSLIKQVKKNWVTHKFWNPQHWNVFKQIVRTTEDVEGWYKKIKEDKEGVGVGFYKLVSQLHNISDDLPIQGQLVSESKLYHLQKAQGHSQQLKLFKLWKKYLNHKISLDDLIDASTLLDYPLL